MAYPVTVAPVARDAAIASLSELLGDRLSTGESVRQQHGRDASYHACAPPDAVAFPQSTEEVSAIVKICARHKMPIVPFGVGSGMEGNVVALQGGSGQRTEMIPKLREFRRPVRIIFGDADYTLNSGVDRTFHEFLPGSELFLPRCSTLRPTGRTGAGRAVNPGHARSREQPGVMPVIKSPTEP